MLLKVCRMNFGVLRDAYLALAREKQWQADPQQLEVLEHLQSLRRDLESSHSRWKISQNTATINNTRKQTKKEPKTQAKKNNFFSGLFRRQFSTTAPGQSVQGMYLYGGSGCGKSVLCDLFYDKLQIRQKQRVHFHEFMSGVHADLFELERSKKGFDPLVTVAARRAKAHRLLYLDQFQVTDVADASILRRLFQQLLAQGLVLLATSNRHPSDLYKGGHQRQFFLPFIDLLVERCKVVYLKSQDYRLAAERSTDSKNTTFIDPLTPQNQQRFMRVLSLVASSKQPFQFQKVKLEPVKGRKLVVPKVLNGTCLYDFDELVEGVMGDVDFRAICKRFRAIFIRNVKPIQPHQRNKANRLIKLFDQAYFRRVKVYLLASDSVENILTVPEHPRNQEQFAIVRCHSRLIQFQTKQYMETISFCQQPENLVLEGPEEQEKKVV